MACSHAGTESAGINSGGLGFGLKFPSSALPVHGSPGQMCLHLRKAGLEALLRLLC